MAMRALSGIIVCNVAQGSVTVSYDPHEVQGADGRGAQLFTTGASGPFARRPAVMVALREIETEFHSFPPVGLYNVKSRYQVNTSNLTRSSFRVTWRCVLKETFGIRELSYMVVGDV